MKSIRIKSILCAFVASFIIASCTSSVEPIDPAALAPGAGVIIPPGNTDVLSENFFKIDYNNQTHDGELITANVIGNQIYIAIANILTGEKFSIILNGTTAGTYNGGNFLQAGAAVMAYTPSTESTINYINVFSDVAQPIYNGTVTIDEIDPVTKLITGSVLFRGNDLKGQNPAIDFTNGTFKLFINYQGATPPDHLGTSGYWDSPTNSRTTNVTYKNHDIVGTETSNEGSDPKNYTSLSVSFRRDIAVGTYLYSDVINIYDAVAGVIFRQKKNDLYLNFETISSTVNILTKTAHKVTGTLDFKCKNLDNNEIITFTNVDFSISI